MPPWISNLFPCFGGLPEQPQSSVKAIPPTNNAKARLLATSTKNDGEAQGSLDLIPIFWPYLSFTERIALRACCRESRRIHDTLVTDICVCDNASVLSRVPRLPRNPLPTCSESAQQVAQTLHGFTARGCQPRTLFLCITEGHERRRHEEGLAVLLSLPDTTSELSAVHLCGVPLTPQVARALKALLSTGASVVQSSFRPGFAAFAAPSSLGAAAPPSLPAAPSIVSTPTPRSLATVSPAPPALPLHLSLYGYDIVRQPAGVSVEMLIATAAPRLTKLELWGCVGWPKRLSALLHNCAHLRRFVVSFQQLCPPDAGCYASCPTAGGAGGGAAAAMASGAVVAFPQLSAAITTTAVVKALGSLHHLRSLELRGCVLNLARGHMSSDAGGGGAAAAARPARPGVRSKAALERAAVAEAAPSVQQLASALFQLTSLTRLAIDGLNSAAPLLTAFTAMKYLRELELPDAAAPAAADLGAIARAAPRLVALTLGTVGPRSVLDASASATAATAANGATEVLPLPPTLTALRVVRCRPTLRTMRSLRRTVEARAAAPAPPAADAAAAAGGGPPKLALVVPGIDIDMLDVEYDALQGFSRGSDGVLRSTLLPEAAEALAASIRLLAPRPSSNSKQQQQQPSSQAADGSAAAAAAAAAGSGASVFCSRRTMFEGDDVDAEPAFGHAWTSELMIHNAQGSLGPPSLESENPPVERLPAPASAAAKQAEALGGAAGAGAEAASVDGPMGHEDVHVGCTIQPWPLVGHAVWISEMRPLGLTSLELYGIGVMAGDLEQVAQMTTLRRLILASGELEVDALPYLAALPDLEYLELARCTPCRHRRVGGAAGAASGTGYARASAGTGAGTGNGYARASAGAGGIAVGRPSFAGSDAYTGADGDGDDRRPTGKRALLELCVTAPRLKRVLVVRCTGVVCRAESAEGPLGAEWVRQRLLALGPRNKAPAADTIGEESPSVAVPPPVTAGRGGLGRGSLGRLSLTRGSRRSMARFSERDLGWPEVAWD